MINKTILVALLLVTTASVVAVGGYYATNFLREESETVTQREAPPAQAESADAQDAPLGTVDLDELLAESPQEPAADEEADVQTALQNEDPEPGVAEDPDGLSQVAPSFDVIRVEPSGEFMAAGRSAPNARVEMLLGSEILASDAANNAGEWTMVPDEPLPAGRHDLLVRATREDRGTVDGDRVAVVIEEAGGQPLVAVTPPGEATSVIQRPEQVALAQPGTGGAEEPRTGVSDAAKEAASQVEQSDAPRATPQPSEGRNGQALADRDAGDLSGSDGSREGESPRARAIAEATDDAEAEPDAAEIGPAQEGSVRQENMAALPEAERTVGGVEENAGAPPVANAALAIDTVEVERADRLYLSGRGAPNADIRLYVNQEHVGDVRAGADGSWSGTSERQMPPGRYTVRADLIGADGDVAERAEVSFDRVRVATTAEGTKNGGENAAEQRTAPEPENQDHALRAAPATEDADMPGAETGDQASLSPSTVYIERGDNLWHIARQVYGEGTRYTVIYEANESQIRDPDLIFPGQVFTIPLADESGD